MKIKCYGGHQKKFPFSGIILHVVFVVLQGALVEDKDRYQLWLNYNYILNVPRASLSKDFSHLALDPKGEVIMKELQRRLKKVQEQMPSAPKKAGLLYPDELDCNVAS